MCPAKILTGILDWVDMLGDPEVLLAFLVLNGFCALRLPLFSNHSTISPHLVEDRPSHGF